MTPRLLRALILTSIGVLLAAPMQVAAAPRGTSATLTVNPLVADVSTSEPAAFDAVFAKDEQATFTHVVLTGAVSGGTVTSVPTGCTATTTTVSCDLGTVTGGRSLTFVLTAASVPGELSFSATVAFDAAANNKKAASRDTVSGSGAVPIVDRPDYLSRWQAANEPLTASTDPVGPTKPQSTAINVPGVPFGYNAVLHEHDGALVCDGTEVGFGQSVDLQIANGEPVAPYIEITLTYDLLTATFAGKTPLNVGVVHLTDGGECTFPPRGCDAGENFCYDARYADLLQTQLVVTVRLPSNGVAKGV